MDKDIKLSEIISQRNERLLCQKDFDMAIKLVCDENCPKSEKVKFLQDCYNNELTFEETFYLTKSMLFSGKVNDFSDLNVKTVDKHSTGGVSDSTTIAIMPVLACLGLYSIKMSGRSLGHTGGTIDKLERIEGFNVELLEDEAKAVCKKTGLALVSQSKDLAVADKIMYKLRDEIGATKNEALIASSIMSKKLASGSDNILLDVKTGEGALLEDFKSSLQLAKTMTQIGKTFGKNTRAIITDMSQPLGRCIGDEFELCEALEVLCGANQKSRLFKLCVKLCVEILLMTKTYKCALKAKHVVIRTYKSGLGFEKLKQVAQMQGGKLTAQKLIAFEKQKLSEIISSQSGFVSAIKGSELGKIYHEMRKKFDGGVGIKLAFEVGDKVKKGQVIAYVSENCLDFADQIRETIKISNKKVKKPKLVLATIR